MRGDAESGVELSTHSKHRHGIFASTGKIDNRKQPSFHSIGVSVNNKDKITSDFPGVSWTDWII